MTAWVNDLGLLSALNLSLQVSSRVTTGPDGKCEEDVHLSQVEIVSGAIADEFKRVRYYHQEMILWPHSPEIKDYSLSLSGVAPPGAISFEWKAGACAQVLLYQFDARGYTYVATVFPMLPEGRSWNETPQAEVTKARVYSDGRFDATAEIWDQGLLSYDHLVLVVRSETKKDNTNVCRTEKVMGAARIN